MLYQLDFIREIPRINNLSSLTFNNEQGYLYATQNTPATLLKLSQEGNVLDAVPLPFVTDAETIEHINGDIFAAIDESTSELFIFTVAQDMTITLRNSIPLPPFEKKNRGFEGLAWNADKHILYVAKERKPHCILTWQMSPELYHEEFIQLTDFPYKVDVNDISALDYSNGKLMVLSDESHMLLETSHTDVTYTKVLHLVKGKHGLTADIPQPEGVARTPDGNIYIASEPNIIARFRPVKPI